MTDILTNLRHILVRSSVQPFQMTFDETICQPLTDFSAIRPSSWDASS